MQRKTRQTRDHEHDECNKQDKKKIESKTRNKRNRVQNKEKNETRKKLRARHATNVKNVIECEANKKNKMNATNKTRKKLRVRYATNAIECEVKKKQDKKKIESKTCNKCNKCNGV